MVLLWEKYQSATFCKNVKRLVRWFSSLRLGGMGWTILPALFASQGCEEEVSGKAGGHHQCSMDLYSQGSLFDRPTYFDSQSFSTSLLVLLWLCPKLRN